MSIRKLKPEDWVCWQDVRLEAIQATPENFGAAFEEESQFQQRDWQKFLAQHDVYGDFSDGCLVAIAGLSRETTRKKQHRATIFSMYTKPSYRGQGKSRALLTHILMSMPPEVEQVHLCCAHSNEIALAFYNSVGFKSYGTEPRALCIEGKYVDLELMVLERAKLR